MAKSEDYVPARDGDKVTWAGTLKTKIAVHGATVGLAPADITATQGDCDSVVNEIGTFNTAKATFEQAGATKKTNVNAAVKKIRARAQAIKKHSGYSIPVGEALGIIGDEVTVDLNTAQPELKLRKDPSGWRVEFNLKDFFEGVNIYKKKAADAGFAKLTFDTHNPYIDNAPVDNGTRYYAFYVYGDTEVGLQSAEVVISL
ncbi:MAG: hypothetical protein JJE25_01240 [Bacteroidia bacterium]|nr:hypothetical protein [Bacteroidia bacterium]